MACRPRNLSCKSQGYTFIWLNAYNQLVWNKALRFRRLVELVWYPFEMDRHFGAMFWQAFARTDVERNIGPAPVFDEQFQRNECFSRRVRSNAFLFFVTWYRLSVNHTCRVLSTYHTLPDIFRREEWNSAHHFD